MKAQKTQKTTLEGKVSKKDLKPVVLGGIAPTNDNELEMLTKGAGIQGDDDGDTWYVW